MAPSPLHSRKSKSPTSADVPPRKSPNILSSATNSPAGISSRSSSPSAFKSFEELKENKSEKIKGPVKSASGRQSPVPRKPWVSPTAKVPSAGSPKKRVLVERNESGNILGLPSPLRDAAGQPHFQKLALITAASPPSKEVPMAVVTELHNRIQRFLDDQQALLHITNVHPFNLDQNSLSPMLSSCGSHEHQAAYHPVQSPFVPRPQFLRLQAPTVAATSSRQEQEGDQQQEPPKGQQEEENRATSYGWKVNLSSFTLDCGLSGGPQSSATEEKACVIEKETKSIEDSDKCQPLRKDVEEEVVCESLRETKNPKAILVPSALEETIPLTGSVAKVMELTDDNDKIDLEETISLTGSIAKDIAMADDNATFIPLGKNEIGMDIEKARLAGSAETVSFGLEEAIICPLAERDPIALKHVIEEDAHICSKFKIIEHEKFDDVPYSTLKQNAYSISSYPGANFLAKDSEEQNTRKRETLSVPEEESDELEEEGDGAVSVGRKLFGVVINFLLLATFASVVLLSAGNSALLPLYLRENHLSVIWYESKYHQSTLQFLKGMNGLWNTQMTISSYPAIDIRFLQQNYGILRQEGDRLLQKTKEVIPVHSAGELLQMIEEKSNALLHPLNEYANSVAQNFPFHLREFGRNIKNWSEIVRSWSEHVLQKFVLEEETPDYEEDIQSLLEEWDLIQEFDLEAADEYFMEHLSESQREDMKKNLLRLTDAPEIQFILSDLFTTEGIPREQSLSLDKHFRASGSHSNGPNNLDIKSGVERYIYNAGNEWDHKFDAVVGEYDSLQTATEETTDKEFEIAAADVAAWDSREAQDNGAEQRKTEFTESPREKSMENAEVLADSDVALAFTTAVAMEEVLDYGKENSWESNTIKDPSHPRVAGKDGQISAHMNEDDVKNDESRSETTANSEVLHEQTPPTLEDANVKKIAVGFWVWTAAIATAPIIFLIARKQQSQKSARFRSREVEFLRKEWHHGNSPTATVYEKDQGRTPVLVVREDAERTKLSEIETIKTSPCDNFTTQRHAFKKEGEGSVPGIVEASEAATDSSPYGSFTTYRLVPKKEGQCLEPRLTPIRRSSRLRNQVISPKGAKLFALSPP